MKNERINRNTILLMWFLVGLGCLYIFHMYVIGNYTIAFYDVGTDGKDQYIMWYNGIVNSLRDGNFSPWDFRNGFGMNTMGHPDSDLYSGCDLRTGAYHLVYGVDGDFPYFCSGNAVLLVSVRI